MAEQLGLPDIVHLQGPLLLPPEVGPLGAGERSPGPDVDLVLEKKIVHTFNHLHCDPSPGQARSHYPYRTRHSRCPSRQVGVRGDHIYYDLFIFQFQVNPFIKCLM